MDAMNNLAGADLQARAQLAVDSRASVPRDGDNTVEAAKRFEALLASMLVKELRQTLPEGFFGGGAGADIYAGWLDTHLSEALAESDALGIAGMVKAELGRIESAAAAELAGEER
jgi:Rod binding domain-containing protein